MGVSYAGDVILYGLPFLCIFFVIVFHYFLILTSCNNAASFLFVMGRYECVRRERDHAVHLKAKLN